MKVTSLKQQVSQLSRYSVYIDGRFSFALSADAVLGSGIGIGEELNETRLRELKLLSADDKAYASTLRYVTIRHRSEYEVTSYLQRKNVSEKPAADIVRRLKDLNLLNDLHFARAWVTNRRLLKATNKRRLTQELRQKRISESIISTVLAEDETDDSSVLRELIAKKRQIPRYRDNDLKLMQYLARQGYSYDAIKSALNKTDLD